MSEISRLIGSETGQTIRKRESRLSNQGKFLVKNTQENRYKRLDNRDKSTDIRDKKENTRHKHGQYSNVLLTDEEFEKLKNEFPTDYEQRIERVSEYCASTGRTYKNYLATIRVWARKDKPRVEEPKKEYRQPWLD